MYWHEIQVDPLLPQEGVYVKMENGPFAYLMLNRRNGYVKIGVSNNPAYREKTLQSEEPEVILLAIAYGGYALEAHLHEKYARQRLRGEWFNLRPEDMRYIVEGYVFEVEAGQQQLYWSIAESKSFEAHLRQSLISECQAKIQGDPDDELSNSWPEVMFEGIALNGR